jgi:putative DNA primase/helicase
MSIKSTSEIQNIEAMINAGFSFVSIPLGKKGPSHAGWNRRKNVISKLDQISSLPSTNIGLAHAYCTPYPTCSIDLDDAVQAEGWLSERGINFSDLENGPDSVGISSGKKNSSKLIYRLPDGVPALASIAITGAAGDMMLELRCATKRGLTVQDVLPPSIHPSGSQYRWVGAGSILNLPVLPDCLLQIWLELIQSKHSSGRSTHVSISNPETPRQIAIIQQQLEFIDADCDYETYRNVIWGVASTGWECAYKIALEWSLTAEHRFEEHTLDALFYSYDPERDDRITVGTIYHYAKQGGA